MGVNSRALEDVIQKATSRHYQVITHYYCTLYSVDVLKALFYDNVCAVGMHFDI